MAYLQFENIGIKALSAAIPKRVINNLEYTEHFPKEDVAEIVEKVGIYERRFAEENTTSSDLCFAAAEKLLEDNEINKEEVDLIIFLSQTPDYRMPATSVILQDKLGFPKSTMAFDVNMGCAGFIYGLSIGFSFLQQPHVKKVLLLNGETRSKVYSPKDRKVAFLFGDAGVAALLEKNEEYGMSYFSLNSDGSRESLIKIDAGGYRNPSSVDTIKEKVVDEFGNIRSDEQGYMNGADVFNFLIREIPRDIKNILKFSKTTIEDFDYYVFHQANKYINSYLGKKLKMSPEKTPMSIHKYGNTSSVSIPLTIVSELKEKLNEKNKVLLSGFGVGLAWASSVLNLTNCSISDIVEV